MTSVISLLLAIFQAVPILKELWEQAITLWINTQIDKMTKENRDAIKKAITEHDQRALEELISTRPGEPSGLPGTHERPVRVRDEN